ncbi:MAG: Nif3-like dinuclear metal center hexameric protein [Clostridioides sp.]|jgi:dinuclear metal center YbgI/SA1388 family protein|nr:Nif3-like dinuclear metal center hexameric protein [Clostridioides sp.]
MNLKDITNLIEKKYPLSLAYDWDNVGLMVGEVDSDVKKILLTIDANEDIIDEAIQKNVDLIITHHPFIFSKLKNVNTYDLKGKLIYKLIKNNISLYSMHTNFDIAKDGMNDYFMKVIGIDSSEILESTYFENLYYLNVYVPNDFVDKVKLAIGNAGGGSIGNYSHCSFSIKGEGGFCPKEGSNPFIGIKNTYENVDETKLEVCVSEDKIDAVVKAMLESHPYEEVAYGIYKLENKINEQGIGRIGNLKSKTNFKNFANEIKTIFDVNCLRVVGDLDKEIEKVAVVTGAGSDYIKLAKRKGADVFITGDMKYHEAQMAEELGICVVDLGHFESENIFKDVMKSFLEIKIEENFSKNDLKNSLNEASKDSLNKSSKESFNEKIEIIASDININPFKTLK